MSRTSSYGVASPRLRRGLWVGATAVLSVATLSISAAIAAPAGAAPVAANAPLKAPLTTSLARVRLLSQAQYFNSIGYIFGPSVTTVASFAPLPRIDGLLEVGASTAAVGPAQIGDYQRAASALAEQIVGAADRGYLMQCQPTDAKRPDPQCARQFLSKVGRLLYRRPIDGPILDAIVASADSAAARLKNFYTGLSYSLADMLISPEVLFAADESEPDPHHPGMLRLDPYSIATRLSLFLWNSTPDNELLREAQSGQLETVEGRARAVDRMLASPRLVTGTRAFFSDMLNYDDFGSLAKDPQIYPDFTGATAAAAPEQTLRTIVNLLLVKKADYRDLFTTRDTFISPILGPIYDVPAVTGWHPYQFPADGSRAGLLTMVSFLASHSHPGQSSPTLRGRAIRELLLCEKIPNPPANVNFSALTDPNPALKTMRQRLTEHRANPVCAGCHRLMDPIGLGLENFDGAGQFRATQNGAVIDASGTLDGIKFANAKGLGQALHDDPALPTCLVQRLYAYAVGGLTEQDKKSMLPYLDKKFAQERYRLPSLMRTIALSPAFVEVREAQAPKPTPVVAMEQSAVH